MYCKNCGSKINEGATYCSNCGKAVKELIVKNSEKTEPSYVTKSEDLSKFKGIEGWLTLVVLGLFVTTGYGVYIFLDTTFNSSATADSSIYFYDLINGLVMATLGSYVIFLCIKRKKNFKNYYIMLWVYMVIQGVITYSIVSSYTSDTTTLAEYSKNMGRNIVGAIVWGLYAVKSKRVKATFINN